MSYESHPLEKWVDDLYERNYGVKEVVNKILDDVEDEEEMENRALGALSRK